MYLRLLGLLIAALIASIRPVAASDADGNYVSIGPGSQSCQVFVSAMSLSHGATMNAKLFRAWVGGYISGINGWVRGAPDFLEPSTLEQAMRALRSWCWTHPRAKLADAVTEFEADLLAAHGIPSEPSPALQSRWAP